MVINLLPPTEKKELEIEKIGKKLSLIFIFLFIFLLVLIFILFSLKIYILFQIKYSQDVLENKTRALSSSQFQNFKKIIEKTNQNLSKIKNFYDEQIFLTPLLEKLAVLTPQTIYFTNFSFQKIWHEIEKKETGKKEIEILAAINLSGHAATRDDLFFFKKALEKEGKFKDVYFSPTSWVTPTDIDFSLSFTFKK
ncbi:hypothetical protein J7K42_02520 [bacterium]|nr:hypothetical protein [bacterium]